MTTTEKIGPRQSYVSQGSQKSDDMQSLLCSVRQEGSQRGGDMQSLCRLQQAAAAGRGGGQKSGRCGVMRLRSAHASAAGQNGDWLSSWRSRASPRVAHMPGFEPRIPSQMARSGAECLVECLEREGVTTVFAFPGSVSLDIHHALAKSARIRNVFCRHEAAEGFAAEGYAKACTTATSGLSRVVGVCITSNGSAAINLTSPLLDALVDGVPMVAITGQVPQTLVGRGSYGEGPTTAVVKPITKRVFQVASASEIPRTMREAFFVAASGRPGPVLVEVPVDVQRQLTIPSWDFDVRLDDYIARCMPHSPGREQIQRVLRLLQSCEKPVIVGGGGALCASQELRAFAAAAQIPVALTLKGIGEMPGGDPLCLGMLGLHGAVTCNHALQHADFVLSLGFRFSDTATATAGTAGGDFAPHAKVVIIDLDAERIGQNREPTLALVADAKEARSQPGREDRGLPIDRDIEPVPPPPSRSCACSPTR